MAKFKVVSVHFTSECDWNCPICYRKEKREAKPFQYFYDLPKKIKEKEIAEQVALGGGEPFLFPQFIKRFSAECKKNGIICNITTNGKVIAKMEPQVLKDTIKDVTMVSVSLDCYKIRAENEVEDTADFMTAISNLKNAGLQHIGVNLLIDEGMFKAGFVNLVSTIFDRIKPERVFALYPKNFKGVDILKYKEDYAALTQKYPHFYIDDLTNMILTQGYENWQKPCHYGNVLSISEDGSISGCSFDKPIDNLTIDNVADYKFEERRECPYLVR